MNLSQAFVNIINQQVLASVFNGEEFINLDLISQSRTSFDVKTGGGIVRVEYDEALKELSSDFLYSKNQNATFFDRDAAQQIARSKSVLFGRLDISDEYNTNLTFENGIPAEDKLISINDLTNILLPEFLIDIYYNQRDEDNNTITKNSRERYNDRDPSLSLSTYNNALIDINNYYYGHTEFGNKNAIRTYYPTEYLVGLDATNQDTSLRIGDGNNGDGLTLIADTPGLQIASQLQDYVNALVEMRLVFVRDAKVLVGPIRAGLFKIDGVAQSINKSESQNLIKLTLVKTWENINQLAGIRTADSYFRSYRPDDGFFRHASNAAYTKTFKEDN